MGKRIEFQEKSYAKINFLLHVLGKRADGYHDIYTLFAGIELYDLIRIRESKEQKLFCTNHTIPVDNKNIVMQVHNILQADYGLDKNYYVEIYKNIPVGAGLGGGSSNAATYLKAVNGIADLNLSYDEMSKILSKVGSDTVFFLNPTVGIGTGRGEIIQELENFKRVWLLLIIPQINISTGEIYSDSGLRYTKAESLPRVDNLKDIQSIISVMKNDLEQVVFKKHPIISEIVADIKKAGALNAMMSGSGSAVYGIFEDFDSLTNGYKLLHHQHKGCKIVMTATRVIE